LQKTGTGSVVVVAVSGDRAGVVMRQLPLARLLHEEVGRDQLTRVERLGADHERRRAGNARDFLRAGDRRRRAGEDAAPARHHGLATVQDLPARVDARDRRVTGPERVHGGDVAGREGAVEGGVGGEDGGFVFGHRRILARDVGSRPRTLLLCCAAL
jgi:hypothetical protein